MARVVKYARETNLLCKDAYLMCSFIWKRKRKSLQSGAASIFCRCDAH